MNVLDTVVALPDLAEIGQRPYQRRGIFPSELAAVIGLTRAAGIELLIESGRARGHSTVILAEFLPDVEIHSFELKRDKDAEFAEKAAAPFSNLTLHYGDALWKIPRFIRKHRHKRIAVLIDGPKGFKALELLRESILESRQVILGFVHDLNRPEQGPAPVRDTAEQFFHDAFFTDDQEYVRQIQHLDASVFKIADPGWAPYLRGGRPSLSYGPTLGCFVITEGDRKKASAQRTLASRARRLLAAVTGAFNPSR